MAEKPYAGKLAKERQAERRARLVAAGFDLLGTGGMAATSVRAVCRSANLSSRYFYESFADLDELLLAVFEDLVGRIFDQAMSIVGASEISIESAVRAFAEAFVTTSRNDPRVMRIGFVEAWSSEALMRRRVELLHATALALARLVIERSEIADDRSESVHVAAFVALGGLLEAILAQLDGSLAVEIDALVDLYVPIAVAAIEAAIS